MNRKRFPFLAVFLVGQCLSPCAALAGGAQPLLPSLQVLDRVKIDSGATPVIYDRVVPPLLPVPPVLPAPVVAPPALNEGKNSVILFLSATVYDRQFTVLRWFWEGREYRAVSNIDFNYLTGLGTIETEDSVEWH